MLNFTFDTMEQGQFGEVWSRISEKFAPEIDGITLIADAGSAKFGDIVRMRVTEVAGYDFVAEAL
jgi:hypothetical protein